jgi:hypothetical protein
MLMAVQRALNGKPHAKLLLCMARLDQAKADNLALGEPMIDDLHGDAKLFRELEIAVEWSGDYQPAKWVEGGAMNAPLHGS